MSEIFEKHYKVYLENYNYLYPGFINYDPIAMMTSNNFGSVFPHSVAVEKYILFHGLGHLEEPRYLVNNVLSHSRLKNFKTLQGKKGEYQSQHRNCNNNQQKSYLSWVTPQWSTKTKSKTTTVRDMEIHFEAFLDGFSFTDHNLEWIENAREKYAVDNDMKNRISYTSLSNCTKLLKDKKTSSSYNTWSIKQGIEPYDIYNFGGLLFWLERGHKRSEMALDLFFTIFKEPIKFEFICTKCKQHISSKAEFSAHSLHFNGRTCQWKNNSIISHPIEKLVFDVSPLFCALIMTIAVAIKDILSEETQWSPINVLTSTFLPSPDNVKVKSQCTIDLPTQLKAEKRNIYLWANRMKETDFRKKKNLDDEGETWDSIDLLRSIYEVFDSVTQNRKNSEKIRYREGESDVETWFPLSFHFPFFIKDEYVLKEIFSDLKRATDKLAEQLEKQKQQQPQPQQQLQQPNDNEKQQQQPNDNEKQQQQPNDNEKQQPQPQPQQQQQQQQQPNDNDNGKPKPKTKTKPKKNTQNFSPPGTRAKNKKQKTHSDVVEKS